MAKYKVCACGCKRFVRRQTSSIGEDLLVDENDDALEVIDTWPLGDRQPTVESVKCADCDKHAEEV